ncbi:MAG: flagellar biosynthetic protein FliO [Duganella sp.]
MTHTTAASLIVAALLATASLTPAAAQTAPAADAPVTSAAPATAAPSATDAATAPAAPAANATTAPNPVRPAQPLGVPAAPYSAAPSGGGLLQTTFALMFVIALLVGGAWVLKRFGPRGFGGGSNTVKLVGALSVGARERILVVEVGEQWIVVGASPGRMNALATMPRQETVDAPAQAMAAPANFADWIKHTIDKRNGKQ